MSVAVVIAGACAAAPALAFDFDFFGLFGTKNPAPAANRETLPYTVSIEGAGGADLESDLRSALESTSTLYRLRDDPPPDGESLIRRIQQDVPRLTDVVWGSGYYDGLVTVATPEGRIDASTPVSAGLVRWAESYRGRAQIPLRIVVDPGPLFRLRTIAVNEAQTGRPFSETELPPRVTRHDPDEGASAANAVAIEARIVDNFRAQGHPFVKVVSRNPVVDHRSNTLDIAYSVDPGPVATIGPITVSGAEGVDPAVIRSFIYTEPGDPYSPKALTDLRKSVSRIEALGSVRIREGDRLDANGGLPVMVDVTERPPRLVGFSARYSTVDGPGVKAYWAHRNLFGGAERLRFDAELFYTERNGSPLDEILGIKQDEFDWSNLGGRFTASFLKPALSGSRFDFLLDARIERDTTDSYTSRSAGSTAALRYRFSDTTSVRGGIEVERGQTSDPLGQIDYTLVGIPLSVTYDSTNNLLDPTEGIRLNASVAPYPTFLGSDPGITIARADASAYFAFDEEARTVLAGRVGFGSITGAPLDEIPANRRFYAGGGGSVRGYKYRSLSPLDAFGQPIGGRSLLEGSLEARIKVTETIGIVPFVDAGMAFESSLPDFDENIQVAAGLGLRYYTSIGPIRVDVATPINPRRGDANFALYIGLGQAF
jgi:translocation and assembly module TamA